MDFNRKLVGLPVILPYEPPVRTKTQYEGEEEEESKMHQTKRSERNEQRKRVLLTGRDSVVEGRDAGPKWDRPRSPTTKLSHHSRRGSREASMGFYSDDHGGYGVARVSGTLESNIDRGDYATFAGPTSYQPRSLRPQYRPRRDSNEAVVGFGGEANRFGLVSRSGRFRVGKQRGDGESGEK
jgi:hypothetical protein